MFRKLGFPWELQALRVQQEYEQWRDLILSDDDYEVLSWSDTFD